MAVLEDEARVLRAEKGRLTRLEVLQEAQRDLDENRRRRDDDAAAKEAALRAEVQAARDEARRANEQVADEANRAATCAMEKEKAEATLDSLRATLHLDQKMHDAAMARAACEHARLSAEVVTTQSAMRAISCGDGAGRLALISSSAGGGGGGGGGGSAAAAKAKADAGVEAATSLRLRAELEKVRTMTRALTEEVAMLKKSARSTELAGCKERIRALTKLLEQECEGRGEVAKLKAESQKFIDERNEWAARFGAIVRRVDGDGGDLKGGGNDASASYARRALDFVRAAQEKRADAECALHAATKRCADLEATVAEVRAALAAATTRAVDFERTAAAASRRAADSTIAEKLHRREVESLRTLLKSFDREGAFETADGALASLRARCVDLESNLDAARAALQAAGESMTQEGDGSSSSGGAVAPAPSSSVRVVHLVANPASLAAEEVALRRRATADGEDDGGQAATASSTAGLDATKLHARLKERFREHLNWFREAVYVLTGFEVELVNNGDRIRLRSIFAERESDTLDFSIGDDGVQLLATPFAAQLDQRLFSALTLSNSVPAFLANIQLHLFSTQTLH